MSTTPRVVIIGAGIVGTNLADELTARGVDPRHRRRPGPAAADRRLDLARARAGVPGQPVEDDDRSSRPTPSTSSPASTSTARGASRRSAGWRSPRPRNG